MTDFLITTEVASDAEAINSLNDLVFGPGRFVRTAFTIRDGTEPDERFCFVAKVAERLVGSVRLTPIYIGEDRGYLLGPLCVLPAEQGRGCGKALVAEAVAAAGDVDGRPVVLVGDAPYYQSLGFQKLRGVKLPGPVDYDRLLVCGHDVNQLTGMIRGGV